MALNWAKDRSRRQSSAVLRDEIDRSAYLAELSKAKLMPRGNVWLTCRCGHYGKINNTRHKRFRCSKCGKLWIV
jgi:streptogramin lyase